MSQHEESREIDTYKSIHLHAEGKQGKEVSIDFYIYLHINYV